MKRWLAAAALSAVLAAGASPGDFRTVVGAKLDAGGEDAALHGFVLLDATASKARAVGTAGRAFSVSRQPDNILWGMVTETILFPEARGHAVGLESGVANMAHDNEGELRGIDVVLKNRMDVSLAEPVPVLGRNRYNARSSAIYVSAQPRSPTGEYSGWQAGIRFAPSSLDRTAEQPYAAAIDLSEVRIEVPLYLVVWRCGPVKCGLALDGERLTVVVDVERR